MYIAHLETDISILLLLKAEKKAKKKKKAEEIQTQERKLTFHVRGNTAIMFVTHWLLLINRNRAFLNVLICLRNLRWF